MGLSNSSKATYVGTFNGQFIVSAPPEAEGATSRINKAGNTVWEYTYNRLSGFIKDAKTDRREHNGKVYRSVKITIEEAGVTYILSLPLKGNPALTFFQTMESLAPSLPVEFSIWRTEKDSDAMVIRQNGETLKWKYTQENPGNKPAWVKKTIDGEDKWDRGDELTFFNSILENSIRPKFQQSTTEEDGIQPSLHSEDLPPNPPVAEVVEDDDLPF